MKVRRRCTGSHDFVWERPCISGQVKESPERVLKCREKKTMTKRLRVCVVALAITCVKKRGTQRFGRVARRRALFTKVDMVSVVAKGDRCDMLGWFCQVNVVT